MRIVRMLVPFKSKRLTLGERLNKRKLAGTLGFVFFFLAMGFAFFIDGAKADFTSLSNDQFNIIPVSMKKDNPNLFPDDEIVGDLKGVNYYTPFFVNSIRFLSLPDHNYLRGLNLLVLIT